MLKLIKVEPGNTKPLSGIFILLESMYAIDFGIGKKCIQSKLFQKTMISLVCLQWFFHAHVFIRLRKPGKYFIRIFLTCFYNHSVKSFWLNMMIKYDKRRMKSRSYRMHWFCIRQAIVFSLLLFLCVFLHGLCKSSPKDIFTVYLAPTPLLHTEALTIKIFFSAVAQLNIVYSFAGSKNRSRK